MLKAGASLDVAGRGKPGCSRAEQAPPLLYLRKRENNSLLNGKLLLRHMGERVIICCKDG